MQIEVDDLERPAVHALLEEHLRSMHQHSPPGSVHALDLDALRAPAITFWTAWDGDALLGCGALRAIDADHAEVKSMRTATAHLRKGVASAILQHIISEAARRGFSRLSLETGVQAPFVPAHRMYRAFGFVDCAPFDTYTNDPNSVFMTRVLRG
jgi:putative acetyltransferase